jgi:hypothetical protein
MMMPWQNPSVKDQTYWLTWWIGPWDLHCREIPLKEKFRLRHVPPDEPGEPVM